MFGIRCIRVTGCNITMRWHLGLSCIIHTGCTVQCCVSASMNFVLSISTLVRCVLDNEMGSCQLVGSFISAIVYLWKLCLYDGVLCWFVLACAREVYWFFFFQFLILFWAFDNCPLWKTYFNPHVKTCKENVLSIYRISVKCIRYMHSVLSL